MLCNLPDTYDQSGQLLQFLGEDTTGKTGLEICEMAKAGRIAVINESSRYYEFCPGAHYVTEYEDTNSREILPASGLGLLGVAVLTPIPGDELIVGGILALYGLIGLISLAFSTGAVNNTANYIAKSSARFADFDPEDIDPSLRNQNRSQLEKSKKSFEELIDEHRKKISNPDQYIDPNVIQGDSVKYREGLIRHWESEIGLFQDKIKQIDYLLGKL